MKTLPSMVNEPSRYKGLLTSISYIIELFLVRLKEYKIGIEVQGHHHIFDEYQVYKDDIKRDVFKKLGYTLIEIGVRDTDPFKIKEIFKSLDRTDKKEIIFRRQIYIKSRQGKCAEAIKYGKKAIRLYGDTSLNPQEFKLRVEDKVRYNMTIRELQIGRPIKVSVNGKIKIVKVLKVSKQSFKASHAEDKITVRFDQILHFI